MKLSTLFCAGALAATAAAAPLAELERQHLGRPLDRTTFKPELEKRMNKLEARGRRPRDRAEAARMTAIRQTRWVGDDEPDIDYEERARRAPQYEHGWEAYREVTPPRSVTGTTVRTRDDGREAFRHYLAEDTMPYTADLWDKTETVYPQYKGYAFPKRDGPSMRKVTLENPHIATAPNHDRDEEPPQSYQYPFGAFLSGKVPRSESIYQSQQMTQLQRRFPDVRYNEYIDNRLDRSKSVHVSRGPGWREANGAYDYDPRYGIPRPSDQEMYDFMYPGGQPRRSSRDRGYQTVTIAPNGVGSSSRSRSRSKRQTEILSYKRDIIGQIEEQQSNANDSSRMEDELQIQAYIWAFENARANATELLQPILEDLLNGTNSYLGEAMAWGLYGMVQPYVSVWGPFQGRSSAFGSTGSSNSTTNNTSSGNSTNDKVWTAWGNAVNDFYFDLWDNATAVVNATGLLADLDKYGNYLTPHDTTLFPDGFTQLDEHEVDGFYDFLAEMYDYNGFIFTLNQTHNGDGIADYSLSPEDYADYNGTANSTSSANSTVSKRGPVPVKLW